MLPDPSSSMHVLCWATCGTVDETLGLWPRRDCYLEHLSPLCLAPLFSRTLLSLPDLSVPSQSGGSPTSSLQCPCMLLCSFAAPAQFLDGLLVLPPAWEQPEDRDRTFLLFVAAFLSLSYPGQGTEWQSVLVSGTDR